MVFVQKCIVKLESIVDNHLCRLINMLDGKVGQEVDMKQKMLGLIDNIISVTIYNQDPLFFERDSTVVTAETLTGKKYEADLYKALYGLLHVLIAVGWLH